MRHLGHTRRTLRATVGTACLTSIVLVGTAVVGGPANADLRDDKRSVEREIDALQEDMEHTSAALANANEALRRSQAAVPAARNLLAAEEQARADAEARNEQAEVDLARAREDERTAQESLAATREELAEARDQVAGFAAQLYEQQGGGALELALEATDPGQLADRMSLTNVLADIQNDTLARLSTAQASLRATQDFLRATRAKIALAQAAAQETLSQAVAAADAARAAKADLDALVAEQSAATQGLENAKASEQERYDDLNAESDRIGDRLREIARAEAAADARRAADVQRKREAAARRQRPVPGKPGPARPPAPPPAPPTGPPAAGAYLSAPVRTGRISSEFGMRFHPVLNYWRLHSGRDYAAACGTPVYAAAPGSIVSAGWGGGYGNRVILIHGLVGGQSLATTYNHLQSIAVGGGSVARGQIVGYVGTTGLSTGCHLHFEARVNGVPKDPRGWL